MTNLIGQAIILLAINVTTNMADTRISCDDAACTNWHEGTILIEDTPAVFEWREDSVGTTYRAEIVPAKTHEEQTRFCMFLHTKPVPWVIKTEYIYGIRLGGSETKLFTHVNQEVLKVDHSAIMGTLYQDGLFLLSPRNPTGDNES